MASLHPLARVLVGLLALATAAADPALAEAAPAAGPAPAVMAPAAIPPTAPVRLSRDAAEAAVVRLWAQCRVDLAEARQAELASRQLRQDAYAMRFAERVFGAEPAAGHSLWISLHGGGGTTAEVNTQQWQNQVRLYEPAEGIYVAPRAPTDAWDLWHQPHVDALLDRLIEDYVVLRGVDPDRVYLLGYSAGGDGVYQLAPRLADRLAAAAMMAGHPNDASPLGLRNLPFAIFAGANDAAYNRNTVAAAWGARLDALRAADPGGYLHQVRLYEGLGHWMERRDAEALPWMQGLVRQAWPRRVVWKQSRVTHSRFYWLALPEGTAQPGQLVTATVSGQVIELEAEGVNRIVLRLRDDLLDLDRPVRVRGGGRDVCDGPVPRTLDAVRQSLAERADPRTAATALLDVSW